MVRFISSESHTMHCIGRGFLHAPSPSRLHNGHAVFLYCTKHDRSLISRKLARFKPKMQCELTISEHKFRDLRINED